MHESWHGMSNELSTGLSRRPASSPPALLTAQCPAFFSCAQRTGGVGTCMLRDRAQRRISDGSRVGRAVVGSSYRPKPVRPCARHPRTAGDRGAFRPSDSASHEHAMMRRRNSGLAAGAPHVHPRCAVVFWAVRCAHGSHAGFSFVHLFAPLRATKCDARPDTTEGPCGDVSAGPIVPPVLAVLGQWRDTVVGV